MRLLTEHLNRSILLLEPLFEKPARALKFKNIMSTALTLLPALLSATLLAGCAGLNRDALPESRNTASFDTLFGYQEIQQTNIAIFQQWLTVIAQDFDQYDNAACDAYSKPENCDLMQWYDFLRSIDNLSAEAQLDAVNRFVNNRYYVEDTENYGLDDYWAAPNLFLDKGGDCEDYAIMKLMSLKLLGWSDDSLRIVVVQDTKLRRPHAILAVSSNEQIWILDNQSPSVAPQRSIAHYAPVYSLNKQNWWLHEPREKHL